MSNKWLIGIIMLWVGCTVIAGICEFQQFGTTEAGIFNDLMKSYTATQTADGLGTIGAWLNFGGTLLSTLWGMLWWDFAIFQGQWGIIRFMFFLPVSIAFIVSLALSMRGTSSI